MGFLSELFGKKKEGPFESYYENGDVPREFFSIGTTDTHYLVKEGIPCASVLSPEPGDGAGHGANDYKGIRSLTEGTKATALAIMRYWDFV